MNQQIVIITGMHRSGTSLVANIIQKAGVHLGDKLVAPNQGNPRGHFEDVDFFQFHENILKRLGQTILVQHALDLNELTLAETDLAKQLIELHHDKQIWGWKDPRTCLFLDFWHNLLPKVNYIFIYRHPLEVILSLLKRGTDLEVLIDPLMAVRAWQVYNQAILHFYQQHSAHCFLANISGVVENVADFVGLVAKKSHLMLQTQDVSALYQSAELRKVDLLPESLSLLKQIIPEAITLYEQLEKQADLSGKNSPSPAPATKIAHLESLMSTMIANSPANELAESINAALLTMLLAILAPQPMTELRKNIHQLLLERQQKEHWLEQQHATHLAWIADLERGKNWLEEQHEAQRVWTAELQQGKNWLEEQWQHWQTVAINQQTTMTRVKQHPLIRLMTRLGWLDWTETHD